MGALDQAEASKLLRASLSIATYTATTSPAMLRLMVTNGNAASAGTPVTGGSYAAQNLTTALGTEANGAVTNTGTVSFSGMPAITTVGCEIWDSTGTPRRLLWGALGASKVTGAGDVLSFSASAISININV